MMIKKICDLNVIDKYDEEKIMIKDDLTVSYSDLIKSIVL